MASATPLLLSKNLKDTLSQEQKKYQVSQRQEELRKKYRTYDLRSIAFQLGLPLSHNPGTLSYNIALYEIQKQTKAPAPSSKAVPPQEFSVEPQKVAQISSCDPAVVLEEFVEISFADEHFALPMHIFVEILGFLPAYPYLLSMRRVSQAWKTCLESVVFPRCKLLDLVDRLTPQEIQLGFKPFNASVLANSITLAQYFPMVETLRLMLAPSFSSMLGPIVSEFHALRILDVFVLPSDRTSYRYGLRSFLQHNRLSSSNLDKLRFISLAMDAMTTSSIQESKDSLLQHAKSVELSYFDVSVDSPDSIIEQVAFLLDKERLPPARLIQILSSEFDIFMKSDTETRADNVTDYLISRGVIASPSILCAMVAEDLDRALRMLALVARDFPDTLDQYTQVLHRLPHLIDNDDICFAAVQAISDMPVIGQVFSAKDKVAVLAAACIKRYLRLAGYLFDDLISKNEERAAFAGILPVIVSHLTRVRIDQFDAETELFEAAFGGAERLWKSRDHRGSTALHLVAEQPAFSSTLQLIARLRQFQLGHVVDEEGNLPLHRFCRPGLKTQTGLRSLLPAKMCEALLSCYSDPLFAIATLNKQKEIPLVLMFQNLSSLADEALQHELVSFLLPPIGQWVDWPLIVDAVYDNINLLYALGYFFDRYFAQSRSEGKERILRQAQNMIVHRETAARNAYQKKNGAGASKSLVCASLLRHYFTVVELSMPNSDMFGSLQYRDLLTSSSQLPIIFVLATFTPSFSNLMIRGSKSDDSSSDSDDDRVDKRAVRLSALANNTINSLLSVATDFSLRTAGGLNVIDVARRFNNSAFEQLVRNLPMDDLPEEKRLPQDVTTAQEQSFEFQLSSGEAPTSTNLFGFDSGAEEKQGTSSGDQGLFGTSYGAISFPSFSTGLSVTIEESTFSFGSQTSTMSSLFGTPFEAPVSWAEKQKQTARSIRARRKP